MEDVTQYIKKYWLVFAVLLAWLTFFAWRVSVQPNDTETPPLPSMEQTQVSAEVLELHRQIEALQEQVSTYEKMLKEIDSLRTENARNTPGLSVRSHYGDLSKRYANDPRIK